MKVYELYPLSNDFQLLTYKNQRDSAKLIDLFDGSSISATWTPIELQVLTEERNQCRPVGDFPCNLCSALVLSSRAVGALRDLLESSGELLPVVAERGTYSLFNVTRVVDALDKVKSEFVYFTSGRIMRAKKYAFIEDSLRDVAIFKLPEFRKGRVFVNDVFVDRVGEAGLLGFGFDELWNS